MFEAEGIRVALPDRSRKPLFGTAPPIEILKGISLSVAPGTALGIVGESGSGKSTLARTMLRFHRPTAGTLRFDGRDITALDERALRPLRARMQIIFQDSQSALNPRLTVGATLIEPMRSYRLAGSGAAARERAAGLLHRVGLAPEHLLRYPHQLSGGQRQRVGIARALALDPVLMVADEIVSGLDVSIQAQILDLLRALRRESDMALVLISHDLSVVRVVCDHVVVMRQGEIVEAGPCAALFARPQHSYTRELIRAVPLPVVDPGWLAGADPEAEV